MNSNQWQYQGFSPFNVGINTQTFTPKYQKIQASQITSNQGGFTIPQLQPPPIIQPNQQVIQSNKPNQQVIQSNKPFQPPPPFNPQPQYPNQSLPQRNPFSPPPKPQKQNQPPKPKPNKKNHPKPDHAKVFKEEEEEEEEEFHFCPHLFGCILKPEKHPWLYHVCKWDAKDCNRSHDPRILHFDNAPCQYGPCCPYLGNPEHRSRFYHRGFPVHIEQCGRGPCCPELQVSGGISSLLNPRDLVLCYRGSEEVLVNEKRREIVRSAGCSWVDDAAAREIVDFDGGSAGLVLGGWVRYRLHDEIVCINRATNTEYLLEFKHQNKIN